MWQPNVVPQQVQQVSYVPQTVAAAGARAGVQLSGRAGLPQGPLPGLPHRAGGVRPQGAVHGVPAGGRAGREAGAGAGVPHGDRAVRAQGAGANVPMVYEEHVDQVPYQVCRMVAYQETVRVPHCVEKRIPVTYTCTVPHDGVLPRAGRRVLRDRERVCRVGRGDRAPQPAPAPQPTPAPQPHRAEAAGRELPSRPPAKPDEAARRLE